MPSTPQPTSPSFTQPHRGAAVRIDPARLAALAAYPHIAGCAPCRAYATSAPARFAVPTVVSATLAHHDAGHRVDILATASQHFAVDD